jgi:hypothetical protein
MGEFYAHTLADLQLVRRNARTSSAAAPPHEPSKWAFAVVDGNASAGMPGVDQPLGGGEMLAAKTS